MSISSYFRILCHPMIRAKMPVIHLHFVAIKVIDHQVLWTPRRIQSKKWCRKPWLILDPIYEQNIQISTIHQLSIQGFSPENDGGWIRLNVEWISTWIRRSGQNARVKNAMAAMENSVEVVPGSCCDTTHSLRVTAYPEDIQRNRNGNLMNTIPIYSV